MASSPILPNTRKGLPFLTFLSKLHRSTDMRAAAETRVTTTDETHALPPQHYRQVQDYPQPARVARGQIWSTSRVDGDDETGLPRIVVILAAPDNDTVLVAPISIETMYGADYDLQVFAYESPVGFPFMIESWQQITTARAQLRRCLGVLSPSALSYLDILTQAQQSWEINLLPDVNLVELLRRLGPALQQRHDARIMFRETERQSCAYLWQHDIQVQGKVAKVITSYKVKRQLLALLQRWTPLFATREGRRFLEEHQLVCLPEHRPFIERYFKQKGLARVSDDTCVSCLEILQAIWDDEPTTQTISRVYVDYFGGFMCDLPRQGEWLEELLHQTVSLDQRQEVLDTMRDLFIAPHMHTLVPVEVLSEIEILAGECLAQQSIYGHLSEVEASLSALSQMLLVYDRLRYPHQYARLQFVLGKLYALRIEGTRQQNFEQALACYDAALQIYDATNFAERWAAVQMQLGIVCQHYADDVLQCERTALRSASDIQVYGLQHFTEALTIYQRDRYPREWMEIQRSMGLLYAHCQDDCAENTERALTCFITALSMQTYHATPDDTASLHKYVADTYFNRQQGERKMNVAQALLHYRAATPVLTKIHAPYEWADMAMHCGVIYLEQAYEEDKDAIDMAITAFQQVIAIYSCDVFPRECALAHIRLGNSYRKLLRRDFQASQKRALRAYETALQIIDKACCPDLWTSLCRVKEYLSATNHDNQDRLLELCELDKHLEACIQKYYREAMRARISENEPDWIDLYNTSGVLDFTASTDEALAFAVALEWLGNGSDQSDDLVTGTDWGHILNDFQQAMQALYQAQKGDRDAANSAIYYLQACLEWLPQEPLPFGREIRTALADSYQIHTQLFA